MNASLWIAQNLNLVSAAEDHAEGIIVFPAEFEIFTGHFPGNPTLPGVCELTCMEKLLEKAMNQNLTLVEINKAKFFSPVAPGETLEISVTWQKNDGGVKASASITSGDRKIAKFQDCRFSSSL